MCAGVFDSVNKIVYVCNILFKISLVLFRILSLDSVASRTISGRLNINIDIFVNCNWVVTRWQ